MSQPGGPLPADIRSSARRKRYLPWHQRILRVSRTHFRGMLLTYLADFLVTTGIDAIRWGKALCNLLSQQGCATGCITKLM